ncbi:MAG: D-glycero-beta-D-manno-heptose-7-phosphate kinase [Verrucomicrobia bacterium]|nr:D-glycero-beta-D-manno-heptose-7-phosphate kinase [Verrucomicrobiota bacterium]
MQGNVAHPPLFWHHEGMGNLAQIHLTSARLKSTLRGFRRLRILVVGDLMLDEFIYGRVSRISPEAPVPVVHVEKEVSYPGGSANVGRNLASLGVHAELSGNIGADDSGLRLLHLLRHGKIGTSGICRSKTFPTIRKTRVLARHQQVVRVDRESPDHISAKERTAVLKKSLQILPRCDALILEDYGKGLFDQDFVDSLLTAASEMKIPSLVDPNIHHPLHWGGATLVKPNRLEAFGALGRPDSGNKEEWVAAGEELLVRWSCRYLLLTLGEHGMLLFQPGEKPYPIASRAREVYDVSGAGDTVISVLAAGLASGLSGAIASELANLAAGIVVAKLGTATVTPEEILEAARHHG